MLDVVHALTAIAGSLLASASILLAAFALGRPLARRWCSSHPSPLADERGASGEVAASAGDAGSPRRRGTEPCHAAPDAPDPFAMLVWSLGLGLVVGGTGLAALGLVGAWYTPIIAVFTLAAIFYVLGEGLHRRAIGWRYPSGGTSPSWLMASHGNARQRDVHRRIDSGPVDLDHLSTPASRDALRSGPPAWLCVVALGLTALAVVGAVTAALAPPTAGDALCYHLELPKEFLARHGLVALPYHDNAAYPLLTEMWYLWALALEGGVAAQLLHCAAGLLLAGAAVLAARPLVGCRWGWLVGAVVLLTPGVTNQMTAPLNDVGLALLTTLAWAAWQRGTQPHGDRRWLLAAGMFLGGALATKYVALLFVAAVAVPASLLVFRRGGEERRRLLSAALTVVLVSASIAGVWYARSIWYHGDPCYPFLSDWIAGAGASGASGAPSPHVADKTPLTWHPADVLSAPWRVVMHPEVFGGRGHQLGALLLAAAPLLLVARRLHGLGQLLAVVAVYLVLWYALRQNVRFLLPVLPLAAIAAVWAIAELARLPAAPRGVCGAVLLLLAGVGAAASLARARDKLAVATGFESREAYLLRCEPTYTAALVTNSLAGRNARVLSQDYRGFYFEASVTRESNYRHQTAYHLADDVAADPLAALGERGFTHLLLAESSGEAISFDDTLTRLVEGRIASRPDAHGRGSLCLVDYPFRDADGSLRRYRLIWLR